MGWRVRSGGGQEPRCRRGTGYRQHRSAKHSSDYSVATPNTLPIPASLAYVQRSPGGQLT